MDRDFHYYGSYLAARAAGFEHDKSLKIATAAQFVDDCHESIVYLWKWFPSKKIEHRFATIDLSKNKTYQFWPILSGMYDMLKWAGGTGAEGNRSVWVPFHFLPGNFTTGEAKHGNPMQTNLERHVIRSWRATEYEKRPDIVKKNFPLLCRPNSDMSQDVINNMVKMYNSIKGSSEDLGLYILGSVMHVLADTFAHQDFTGAPVSDINDVLNATGQEAVFTTKGSWDGIQWNPDEKTYKKVAWAKTGGVFFDSISTYPPKGTDNSYLGHGRAGHLPDTCCIVFKYIPSWSTNFITRNNPEQYLEAFLNMMTALECAKNNSKYTPLTTEELKTANLEHSIVCKIVKDTITLTSTEDMGGVYVKGLNLDAPTVFKAFETRWTNKIGSIFKGDNIAIGNYESLKKKWCEDFVKYCGEKSISIDRIKSDGFFLFTCAAKIHYRFVYNALHGFYGPKMLQDVKFEKYYDPHYNMLDDVLGTLGSTGIFVSAPWRIKSSEFLNNAMRETKSPDLITGLEFLKDTVVNASSLQAAFNDLAQTIKFWLFQEKLEFDFFSNQKVKNELLNLFFYLCEEMAKLPVQKN